MDALGVVELQNYSSAVAVLDHMLKTSAIRLAAVEKILGGRLVTLMVTGRVSAVSEAIDAALAFNQRIAASAVIANPHPEIMKIVAQSAKKLKKG